MDEIPFGEWLPDRPPYQNPGLMVAENVIPIPGGYGPQRALIGTGALASGQCRGARLLFNGSGASVIVGGTADRLFKLVGGSVSQTTGYTDVGAEEAWDFAQFNDFVVATSINNPVQYLTDIDTDTAFSALPGDPPRARYCERVEDFLMLGNLDGHPNRIQWSAFNSPASTWVPARIRQSGYADLPRAMGQVQRIIGGRYPMIAQERGMSRLEYIGPPGVWRATEIEQARGVVAPFSMVTVGFTTYYLAQDGFWATDGNSFEPIGAGRVDRWFFDHVAPASIRLTHGTVDFDNHCVVWAFKAGAFFDRLLRYSWTENRWSYAVATVSRLVEATEAGKTLEQIALEFGNLDELPASLDAERWKGKNRVLSAFLDGASTTEHKTFTGAALVANIGTAEFQPIPGRRALVKAARPLGDGRWSARVVSIQANVSEVAGPYNAPGPAGWAPLRGEGLTHRLDLRSSGEWSRIQGVQVEQGATGAR